MYRKNADDDGSQARGAITLEGEANAALAFGQANLPSRERPVDRARVLLSEALRIFDEQHVQPEIGARLQTVLDALDADPD